MNESQMQRGQQWLEELLHKAGLPATVTREPDRLDPEAGCWLTIDESNLTSQQIEILTGRDGMALDSIQYLANTILNIGGWPVEQGAYTIELNGYRARRQVELLQMAENAATQVRQRGGEVEMASLSSAERRQVHTFLKSYEDIVTESRGREPDRRLVVRLS